MTKQDGSDTKHRIMESTWRLLEQKRGQDLRMADIAKDVGISRQALYLHFSNRTELMIATIRYVDEVQGLDARLEPYFQKPTGENLLNACVDVWGSYIPEIYALAKVMMAKRDTDEAMAAAWNDSMKCLRHLCEDTVKAIAIDGELASCWTEKQATDLLEGLVSIQYWEHLTQTCGWSTDQYTEHLRLLLRRTLTQA